MLPLQKGFAKQKQLACNSITNNIRNIKKLPLQNRIRLFNTNVKSVLLYKAEA